MEKIVRRKITPRNLPLVAFDIFSSYGFTVIILVLLLVLTFLGTLEQAQEGLFRTQAKYFNSLWLVHDLFGVIPIPLPGGYLLMSVLFVNLLAGAIIRSRKNWRHPGMIIAHVGVLIMLLGGFVTFTFSTSGNMALAEGERSDMYQGYHGWVIEIEGIGAGAPEEILVIPHEDLNSLHPGDARTFHSEKLPFELMVSGYHENCVPLPVAQASSAVAREVDGAYLEGLPLSAENEQNLAGAYVTIRDKSGGRKQEAILWGNAAVPYLFESGGLQWTLDLTRKKWRVPFTVVLDKFTREVYPGTEIPKVFRSDITKIQGDSQESIAISMNEPLRYKGYTFFQQSWGEMADRRVYSVFAVVRNPADHWPLYSCIVTTIGLVIHFVQKLIQYLRAEAKRRVAA